MLSDLSICAIILLNKNTIFIHYITQSARCQYSVKSFIAIVILINFKKHLHFKTRYVIINTVVRATYAVVAELAYALD